jgi:hypothetical protein
MIELASVANLASAAFSFALPAEPSLHVVARGSRGTG